MLTPRIEINLEKIAHNTKILKGLYGSKGIDIIGVTKVVCGNPTIANVLIKNGISILADSRLENIQRMTEAVVDAEFLLLRTPFLSQAESVVKYVDISLNSEIIVVKELSKFAIEQNTTHKIILMVEMGDLREGLMPSDLDSTIEQVLELPGIELVGIGTNLACLSGIKPNDEKMEYLSLLVTGIEEKYGISLKYISGGNSANYNWFIETQDIGRINNLRLGESIFLGCETLNRKPIPGLFTDSFTLITEVIESIMKPSMPNGEVTQNAFGKVSKFTDRGLSRRAILGIGVQDVMVSGLTPKLNVEIIGASSDHIIIDTKKLELEVGDELEFEMNYGALLSAMTSQYVIKKTNEQMNAQEYCESVEQHYRRHQIILPTISINENDTPLISLKESGFKLIFEPSINIDYKYMVREAVYEKIGRISRILEKENKILIIRSVWRSVDHQRLLWEEKVSALQKEYPDKEIQEIRENISYFIAPPNKSMHSTGGAVDALIYDLKNDCIMDFGTNEGYKINLNDKCYPYHPNISLKAKNNRKLLMGLFEKEDFVADIKEYWHFDYGNSSWAAEKRKNHAIYGFVNI